METTAQRRRGPRVDLDVREVLLDAAEELFGTEGVDAVSLRSVARAGGVAPAALTHHFPTKHDLLEAVVMRRGEEVAVGIRTRLLEMRGREDLTTRTLVESVLMPFVETINADPVRAIHWLRIVITVALNGDEIVSGLVAGDGDIADLFTTAAAGVPDLPPNAVELRAPIAMFSMLTALATTDLGGYGRPIGPDGIDPEYVDQLALFTSCGLRAV